VTVAFADSVAHPDLAADSVAHSILAADHQAVFAFTARFTKQINKVLGLPAKASIEYPRQVSLSTRLVFTIIGGHRYCRHDHLCLGFGYQPAGVCEYLLPDLIFFSLLIYPS
jgi:hypothetical protein